MFRTTIFVLALSAGPALAAPIGAQTTDRAALKQYCTGDYLTYCGDFAPDSPELNACFKENRTKLSANCQAAIASYTKAQKKG